MSDPFIGEIKQFAFNFAPKDYATCDGQILQITQNQALYSILGVNFGGDGIKTFGLPDLRGRAPMHPGSGPGLTPRKLAEKGGNEAVVLSANQVPSHTHQLTAQNTTANSGAAQGCSFAQGKRIDGRIVSEFKMYTTGTPAAQMHQSAIASAGSGAGHDNMQPYLALNLCIALSGIYPVRP